MDLSLASSRGNLLSMANAALTHSVALFNLQAVPLHENPGGCFCLVLLDGIGYSGWSPGVMKGGSGANVEPYRMLPLQHPLVVVSVNCMHFLKQQSRKAAVT